MKTKIKVVSIISLISALCITNMADAQPLPVDLVVSGGPLITMEKVNGDYVVIEDGAVAISGDEIVGVGTRADIATEFTGTSTIEANGRIIMPGLVNTHGHVPMSLFRGIADDRALADWLFNFIFPAEACNVTPDFVSWGTKLAILEMIRGGTTTFTDMYYFEKEIATVTKAAGMRAVLGETILFFPAPDFPLTDDALQYTEEFLQEWAGDPLITAAIAPHAIYTNTKETLSKAFSLARRYDAPILIHLSETQGECPLEQPKCGKSFSQPQFLKRLKDENGNSLLGPDVLGAHCVTFSDKDIRLMVEADAACAHNPSSNMKLASGIAPVVNMLSKGMRLGLGTDGPASNNDLNMFEEMDLASKLEKVAHLDPTVLPAKQVLEMATIGGARALHMEDKIGSLKEGKKADLILVRTDAPHAVPMYNIFSHLVYSLKASDVDTVVIGGKVLMKDRVVTTLDRLNEAEVLAKAREIALLITKSLPPAQGGEGICSVEE